MKFWRVIFWEFVQNLPLLTGFIMGLQFWRQDKRPAAIVCVAVGCVVAALTIRATEAKIVEGHREPVRVIVVNIVAMTLAASLLVAYQSSDWSTWKADIFLGALAGMIVGGVQSRVIQEPVAMSHCVAFAGAVSLGLIVIRTLTATLPVLASILLATALVTLVVGLIDYGPLARAGGQD